MYLFVPGEVTGEAAVTVWLYVLSDLTEDCIMLHLVQICAKRILHVFPTFVDRPPRHD